MDQELRAKFDAIMNRPYNALSKPISQSKPIPLVRKSSTYNPIYWIKLSIQEIKDVWRRHKLRMIQKKNQRLTTDREANNKIYEEIIKEMD